MTKWTASVFGVGGLSLAAAFIQNSSKEDQKKNTLFQPFQKKSEENNNNSSVWNNSQFNDLVEKESQELYNTLEDRTIVERISDEVKVFLATLTDWRSIWDVVTDENRYVRFYMNSTIEPPLEDSLEGDFVDLKTMLIKMPKRAPHEFTKKWTLVIDGTTLVPNTKELLGWFPSTINSEIEDDTYLEYTILRRPHIDLFLSWVSQYFEVVVMDLVAGQSIFDPADEWVSYWVNYGKMDLNDMGRNPENVLVLGSPQFKERFYNCQKNQVYIPDWTGLHQDTALLDVMWFLCDLSFYNNIKEARLAIRDFNAGPLRDKYIEYRHFRMMRSRELWENEAEDVEVYAHFREAKKEKRESRMGGIRASEPEEMQEIFAGFDKQGKAQKIEVSDPTLSPPTPFLGPPEGFEGIPVDYW